jgi:ADP-ribose pyrophosphatase YjhB (NUDIX family)
MNIKEYELLVEKPLRQATITFLVTETDILLAMKKRGFGQGKWNGVGGKPNEGEEISRTAIRETQEEIKVTPENMELVATLNFYFPYVAKDKNWNQQVLVYLSRAWTGDPQETEEMSPRWFSKQDIPYSEMWWDDEIWLPIILRGSRVIASFMFDENEKIIDQIVEEVNDNF